MRLRPTRRRPTTACRPGVECGCGRTITLTPEEYGRTFQTAPYGTTRWLASYHRRSAIESANGEIRRNARARLLRGGVVLNDNLQIDSLRRFKDDVTEVREGFECGIGLGSWNNIELEDTIETYEVREKPRS